MNVVRDLVKDFVRDLLIIITVFKMASKPKCRRKPNNFLFTVRNSPQNPSAQEPHKFLEATHIHVGELLFAQKPGDKVQRHFQHFVRVQDGLANFRNEG